jgi:hypothetical protein
MPVMASLEPAVRDRYLSRAMLAVLDADELREVGIAMGVKPSPTISTSALYLTLLELT